MAKQKNPYVKTLERMLEARQMIDGQLPIELLVECYQNPKHNMALRVQAASLACVYVHRKMPVAVDVDVKGNFTYTPPPVIQLALPAHLAQKMLK